MASGLGSITRPSGRSVIRRLIATQLSLVQPENTEPVIDGVTLSGRPTPTYGSSMGDHTTAFQVHVNAVQRALQGQGITVGLARLRELQRQLHDLPGYRGIEQNLLPERQAALWKEATGQWTALDKKADKVLSEAGPNQAARLIDVLQQMAGCYLEQRELVPGSTVNVAAVSQGLAGKGKAEAGVTAILDQFAKGSSTAAGVPALQNAIMGSFDTHAAGLASAAENLPGLPSIVPGLPQVATIGERAHQLVVQHMRSIATAYPGVLAAASDGAARTDDHALLMAADPDTAQRLPPMPAMIDGIRQAAMAQAAKEIRLMRRRLDTVVGEYRTVNAEKNGSLWEQGTLVNAFDNFNRLKKDITQAEDYFELPGDPIGNLADMAGLGSKRTRVPTQRLHPTPKSTPKSRKPRRKSPPTRKPGAQVQASGKRKATILGEAEGDEPSKFRRTGGTDDEDAQDMRVDPEEEGEESTFAALRAGGAVATAEQESQTELEGERSGNIAVQVLLDDSGNVSDIRITGRPGSQFPGTQGAHTTAWSVHLDEVRAALRKLSVSQALKLLRSEFPRRRAEMAERLKGFAEPAPGSTTGPENRGGQGPTAAPKQESTPSQARIDPDGPLALIGLQREIAQHLATVNLIPGTGMDAAGTGGKSEAKHRRVLLGWLDNHTGVSAKDLRSAILGLLDVKSIATGEHDAETAMDVSTATTSLVEQEAPVGDVASHGAVRTREAMQVDSKDEMKIDSDDEMKVDKEEEDEPPRSVARTEQATKAPPPAEKRLRTIRIKDRDAAIKALLVNHFALIERAYRGAVTAAGLANPNYDELVEELSARADD